MNKDDVIKIASEQAGKKAEVKKLSAPPTSDKQIKLPRDVKQGLEQHFDAKLTPVRVHTGGNIKDLCKQMKCKAFTIGPDVYVKKTSDAKNSELLAHELTHVIQKSQGRMPKKARPGTALVSK